MNILLVYGGKSVEHDVSVITACLAKGYFGGNVFCAYMDGNNNCYLLPDNITPHEHKTAKLNKKIVFVTGSNVIRIVRFGIVVRTITIDCAVNCCHGLNGEDGSIAGLLQLCNIPVVGSGVSACAISMDKLLTKRVLRALNIPVVVGYEENSRALRTLKYPVVVKPVNLGSSIGVSVAHNSEELENSLKLAHCYSNKVLIERAITNATEINCSAMRVDDKVVVSKLQVPLSQGDILTFGDKYLNGDKGMNYTENNSADEYTDYVQQITGTIYDKLGFSGVIRVDFIVDNDTKRVYVNEINAIPGSLAYGMWDVDMKTFGNKLVRQAISDHVKENALTYKYDSDVLNKVYVKGKK